MGGHLQPRSAETHGRWAAVMVHDFVIVCGRHVFATFAERHDVVDLRVDGSVRIPEHRMLAPWGLVARYRYRRTAICYWRDPADGRRKRPSNTFMKMELGGHPTIRRWGPLEFPL
jgi:hypothetical protein